MKIILRVRPHRKIDRRSGICRRKFIYAIHIPERRSGKERRAYHGYREFSRSGNNYFSNDGRWFLLNPNIRYLWVCSIYINHRMDRATVSTESAGTIRKAPVFKGSRFVETSQCITTIWNYINIKYTRWQSEYAKYSNWFLTVAINLFYQYWSHVPNPSFS